MHWQRVELGTDAGRLLRRLAPRFAAISFAFLLACGAAAADPSGLPSGPPPDVAPPGATTPPPASPSPPTTQKPGGTPIPPPPKKSRAACTLRGTNKRNVLKGTPKRDVICARGGNDVVHGRGGSDIIRGGSGRDRLHGNAGNDTIDGGAGADLLLGGRGFDTGIRRARDRYRRIERIRKPGTVVGRTANHAAGPGYLLGKATCIKSDGDFGGPVTLYHSPAFTDPAGSWVQHWNAVAYNLDGTNSWPIDSTSWVGPFWSYPDAAYRGWFWYGGAWYWWGQNGGASNHVLAGGGGNVVGGAAIGFQWINWWSSGRVVADYTHTEQYYGGLLLGGPWCSL